MSIHNIGFYRDDSNEHPQHRFLNEAILMSIHNIRFYRGDSNEHQQHRFLLRQF